MLFSLEWVFYVHTRTHNPLNADYSEESCSLVNFVLLMVDAITTRILRQRFLSV